MKYKIGFKMVNILSSLSEWLKLKAVSLNVRLSMGKYYKEHGHL